MTWLEEFLHDVLDVASELLSERLLRLLAGLMATVATAFVLVEIARFGLGTLREPIISAAAIAALLLGLAWLLTRWHNRDVEEE